MECFRVKFLPPPRTPRTASSTRCVKRSVVLRHSKLQSNPEQCKHKSTPELPILFANVNTKPWASPDLLVKGKWGQSAGQGQGQRAVHGRWVFLDKWPLLSKSNGGRWGIRLPSLAPPFRAIHVPSTAIDDELLKVTPENNKTWNLHRKLNYTSIALGKITWQFLNRALKSCNRILLNLFHSYN